ncbi:MAG TPA: T9SS type A sorting domain-containing protein [Ignavibacteria bacterium]
MSQVLTLSNSDSNPIGLVTKVGFSTTPDDIDNQNQDVNWADPVFQSNTRFGNFLRLTLSANLNTTQQNNLRKTIDSSLAINREIVLLVPIEINPTQLKSKLSFLNSYFSSNKIQWFELGNEPWTYYYNLGYNPFQSDTSYMRRVRQYAKVIRDSINTSAKIIIGAWEGSAADWNNPVPTGFKWTKQLIDSLYQPPITQVDAISFHLYAARYNNNGAISYNRLLSTGKSIDTGYVSAFSFGYDSYNGLIDLLSIAVGNRNIKIICTEYTQTPDVLYTVQFRKGMGNALVFANTYCYMTRRNVGYFAFHQFGKDTYPPTPIYDGYNCINNYNYNTPISNAVKMLSKMKDSLLSYTFDGNSFNTYGSAWNTGINHLNDSTGSLDSMYNIPYYTSITSRSRDTITYCLVNMSDIVGIVMINLDSTYNKFAVSTMNANSFIDNNDNGNNIKPIDTVVNVRIVLMPKYSIMTITATKGLPININDISTIPDQFFLDQNYPNPFNPTTNIKFNVAKLSDIKIIVYDVLGREVQTLVNESLKPGTYEAVFDASSFSSGVYFYKLITDEFVEMKKMILLK